MKARTVDVENLLSPDKLATEIAERWRLWSMQRNKKIEEWKELRNYLFATDTRTTSNKSLPWRNSTTIPKLTQIRDNLHANYMAALFPQEKWMRWEASDRQSQEKAKTIEVYMLNKVKQDNFETTVSRLVLDYIDYGNCFAMITWANDYTDLGDGDLVQNYIGPRLVRISPFDIVFNPTAASFKDTPKIVRHTLTLGDLKQMVEDGYTQFQEVISKITGNRSTVTGYGDSDLSKSDGFVADGFGTIKEYYESDYVEILEFFGDLYDKHEDVLYKNKKICIVDRAYVLYVEDIPNWNGAPHIYHAGWRERPDNLYAMGPLDNLVGMQYRIDHLENLKADVFDQIAFPILKISGSSVEDFEFSPGERIYVGEEGDVGYLAPDPTALQADFQIQAIEARMEEMAGAPKQAMGFRTPGEKTAFEVQRLESAASRIFQHKTVHFEKVFIEPILNGMLEVARRNLNGSDIARTLDPDTGAVLFRTITREDITGKGNIIPVGARHFAERAMRLQNLSQLWQMKVADPSVGVHLSGKNFARILAEELGEPEMFGDNISLFEQTETQDVLNELQVQSEEQQLVAAEEGI